ncbi:type VI secretion system amidase effector protein Tae4 [Pseudomonas sp.]|uniref:type VI secretion system amidase effector protein Tae4 n=1 Tax=Pseudomonas sp. TaxID=306 RepID=UPI003A97749B
MTSLVVQAGPESTSIEIRRPRFSSLWNAYAAVGNKSSLDVYTLVGGGVEAARAENPAAYANACALRMSWGLNHGGFRIPKGTIIQNKPIYRLAGKDGLPYILKVADIIEFLKFNWGEPDQTLKSQESALLNGKKGIIVMTVSGWSDATGHVTLWDGSTTGDSSDYHRLDSHTYENPNIKLIKIDYWELKG